MWRKVKTEKRDTSEKTRRDYDGGKKLCKRIKMKEEWERRSETGKRFKNKRYTVL
jgi:hypothetical protein